MPEQGVRAPVGPSHRRRVVPIEYSSGSAVVAASPLNTALGLTIDTLRTDAHRSEDHGTPSATT
jgi:hypothetical protein